MVRVAVAIRVVTRAASGKVAEAISSRIATVAVITVGTREVVTTVREEEEAVLIKVAVVVATRVAVAAAAAEDVGVDSVTLLSGLPTTRIPVVQLISLPTISRSRVRAIIPE